VTQDLSEFALHARAILGLPVPRTIKVNSPGASAVVLADGHGANPSYTVEDAPLRVPGTELRLFGKPTTRPGRRMGVGLARGKDVEEARERARGVADSVTVHYDETGD
jgi:phosphoribosylglycinamide formyltransferase 2